MATYVMLTRLTDQGARTVKERPGHILEVNAELEAMGVKIVQQYAVLGRYDFVNIAEAADDVAIARASLEMGARGSIRIETMSAMSAKDLIGSLA